MRLLRNNILIAPLPAEEKKVGGIIILGGTNNDKPKANVIDIGPDVTWMSPGDTIVYSNVAQQEVEGGVIITDREAYCIIH